MVKRTSLRFTVISQRMSHIPQGILLLLGIIINISISSMACEIGELRELRLNVPWHKSLELTDNLTDPNSNSHKSQIIAEPPVFWHNLLLTDPTSHSLPTNHLTG